MSDVRHIGQASLGASIRLPKSVELVLGTLGLPTVDLAKDQVSFSFHRARRKGVWGWATHLHVGRLKVCGPWADDLPFPRRRVEAIRWVVLFARKHGIVPMRDLSHETARQKAREYRKAEQAKLQRPAPRLVRYP